MTFSSDFACHTSSNLLDRYSVFLKAYYTTASVSPDYKWPRTPSTQYVNLAIVKKIRVNRQQANEFTLATLHGDIDQIMKEKEPILFEKVLRSDSGNKVRYVLVEGAPGVGKSTFAWELCRKWDKIDALRKYSLVVIVRLRDKRIQEARMLSDLFHHDDHDFQLAVAKKVSESNGEGLLLIMDGADELPVSVRTDATSIFVQLVAGTSLPKATLLVTSRPSAVSQIVGLKEPDKHIEILGFTEEQIHEYAESVFGSGTISLYDFERYISSTPAIKGMLYIPLNTAIVVEVYQENKIKERSIPNTLTSLYNELCLLLLQRYLISAKLVNDPSFLENELCNLPQSAHKLFIQLAMIAFQGVLDKQLVFTNFPEDIKGLGFTAASAELFTGRRVTQSFLHLTIQEFLAAYYISQLAPDEQTKLFIEHSGKDHLNVVWRFYAGITGFDIIGWEVAKSSYPCDVRVEDSVLQISEGSTRVSLIMLRCLFEAQSRGCKAALTCNEVVFSTGSSESFHPFDFYGLGYCIAHSNQCSWKVTIENLNLQGDLVEMFTSGIQSNQEMSSFVDTLSFRMTPLGDEGVSYLGHLPPSILNRIHVLSLDNCGVDAPAISSLAKLILQMSNLETVSIQLFNKSENDEEETVIDICALLQSMGSCTNLHSLHFPQGFHWSSEGVEALGQLMTPPASILNLKISCTVLSRKLIPILLGILIAESSLQNLSIYAMNLAMPRFHSKLSLLKSNTNLKMLNLDNCPLGNKGASVLCEALATNTSLTHLRLSGSHRIQKNGGEALSLMLKDKNKTLQVMKLSFDKSSGEIVDSTAASGAFPDFMDDHLRSESQGVVWRRNATVEYYNS